MKVSVVFTTYNSPLWLAKVLWGYGCQTHKAFDIVIADDGSTSETADTINRLRAETGLAIMHVRQRDDGFRKCRILNKALLHVDADYVIFTDGDCIPRRDFVAEHLASAEAGHYLSGTYFKLPMVTSQAIQKDDIVSGACFKLAWLRAHGLPRMRKTWKITASPSTARWLNRLTTTACNLKGANASVWMQDIQKVNGFDERMQWGGLDREFGVRLINAGVKPKHVRYNAVCLHLDHSRGYKNPTLVAANKALRRKHQKERVVSTPFGLSQLVESGYTPEAHDQRKSSK